MFNLRQHVIGTEFAKNDGHFLFSLFTGMTLPFVLLLLVACARALDSPRTPSHLQKTRGGVQETTEQEQHKHTHREDHIQELHKGTLQGVAGQQQQQQHEDQPQQHHVVGEAHDNTEGDGVKGNEDQEDGVESGVGDLRVQNKDTSADNTVGVTEGHAAAEGEEQVTENRVQLTDDGDADDTQRGSALKAETGVVNANKSNKEEEEVREDPQIPKQRRRPQLTNADNTINNDVNITTEEGDDDDDESPEKKKMKIDLARFFFGTSGTTTSATDVTTITLDSTFVFLFVTAFFVTLTAGLVIGAFLLGDVAREITQGFPSYSLSGSGSSSSPAYYSNTAT